MKIKTGTFLFIFICLFSQNIFSLSPSSEFLLGNFNKGEDWKAQSIPFLQKKLLSSKKKIVRKAAMALRLKENTEALQALFDRSGFCRMASRFGGFVVPEKLENRTFPVAWGPTSISYENKQIIRNNIRRFPMDKIVSQLLEDKDSQEKREWFMSVLGFSVDLTLIPKLKKLYHDPKTPDDFKLKIPNLIHDICNNLLTPSSDGNFNNVLRWTFDQRYKELDQKIINTMLPQLIDKNRPIEIADIGISDGRTTAEFAEAISKTGIPFKMIGYDLYLFFEIVRTKDRRFECVLTSGGKRLIYKVDNKIYLFKKDQKVPRKISFLLKHWEGYKSHLTLLPSEVEIEKVSLVHPDVEKYQNENCDQIEFREQDAWKPFETEFDFIRVMSLMTPEHFAAKVGIFGYFQEETVKRGIINLATALKRKPNSQSGILLGVAASSLHVYYDFYLLNRENNSEKLIATQTPSPYVSNSFLIGKKITLPKELMVVTSSCNVSL